MRKLLPLLLVLGILGVSNAGMQIAPFGKGPLTDTGGQVFNIVAYGASVTASDNRAAIQAALDAAAAAGGGTVFVPPHGTFNVTSGAVTKAANVDIDGGGAFAPGLHFSGISDGIDATEGSGPSTYLNFGRIHDLHLSGDGATSLVGINSQWARHVKVDHCYITGFTHGGLITNHCNGTLVTENFFVANNPTFSTTIAAGSNGVTLPSGTVSVASTSTFPSSGTFTVDGSTVTYTGKTSTTFTGCTGGTATLATGDAVSSPTFGNLEFDNTTVLIVERNYISGSTTGEAGIKIDRAPSTSSVSKNVIESCGVGLKIASKSEGTIKCENPIVDGNDLENNSDHYIEAGYGWTGAAGTFGVNRLRITGNNHSISGATNMAYDIKLANTDTAYVSATHFSLNVSPTGIAHILLDGTNNTRFSADIQQSIDNFDYIQINGVKVQNARPDQRYTQGGLQGQQFATATLTANSAYPSVAALNYARTANSSPTAYTGFTDGVDGSMLFLRIGDANTTLNHNDTSNGAAGKLILRGGINKITSSGQIIPFMYNGTDAAWHETTVGVPTLLVGTTTSANTNTGGTVAYVAPAGATTFSTTETSRQIVAPCSGTLRNFYVRVTGTQPASGGMTFTVRVNASDTLITTSVPVNQTATVVSDTTHTATVSAGDLISISANNAASATSMTLTSTSMVIQ